MSPRHATVAALPGVRRAVRGLRQVRGVVRRRLAGEVVGLGNALVEQFGPDGLTGWVQVTERAAPVRVAVFVGETEVMATWASDRTGRVPTSAVRGFSLRTQHLWRYCSRQDRVTVRIDDAPVPISGHGLWLTPAQDGQHDLAALREQRARGMVFGRSGRLQVSKAVDAEWQRRVLALYARARSLLRDEFGHDVFLLYGTLLGHVREGGFIGHDNDFDCGYVSRHTDPREAARELQQIALRLVEEGLHVDARGRLLHLHDADDPRVRIDLFHLFFDEAGTLRFPFGAAGTRKVRRSHWQGVRESEFVGAPVLVPVDAERFVEVLYGAGWRRPVPGFDWRRERRQYAPQARLPDAWRDEVAWAGTYARHDVEAGSAFAEHLLARSDLPDAVVDLGCGQGRDAFAFATAGRRVSGVDRCRTAVRHASQQAASAGVADRVAFSVCDVGDAPALAAVLDDARARAQGGALLVSARLLLDAVPEDVQEVLLGVVRDRSRPGDWFAAELRTVADRAGAAARTRHYRRLQDGPALGRRLADDGFVVVEEQEGTGLSPYRGEDPVLYRVLARRP